MQFYDLEKLYKKLQKPYEKGEIFRDFIEGKNSFPFEVPLKKVQQKDIQTNSPLLMQELQKLKASKLPLTYVEYDFKTLGKQNLPRAIRVASLEEYLQLLGKEEEYQHFTQLYTQIITKYPLLQELFVKRSFLVLEYAKEWEKLFLVVDYFLQNKQKNSYIREISLQGIDTKYIEKHKKLLDTLLSTITRNEPLSSLREYSFEKRYGLKYPLPQVRFRILDEKLYLATMSDITLTIEEFEQLSIACERVFVVENKITTLAFPNLEKSIVIFGSGYKVGVLKNVQWLHEKELYYWGDIDSDGFAILSQMRGNFPHVKSLCMDEKTLQTYSNFVVKDPNQTNKELTCLTQEEHTLYKNLNNKRLEQERIPLDVVQQELIKRSGQW